MIEDELIDHGGCSECVFCARRVFRLTRSWVAKSKPCNAKPIVVIFDPVTTVIGILPIGDA